MPSAKPAAEGRPQRGKEVIVVESAEELRDLVVAASPPCEWVPSISCIAGRTGVVTGFAESGPPSAVVLFVAECEEWTLPLTALRWEQRRPRSTQPSPPPTPEPPPLPAEPPPPAARGWQGTPEPPGAAPAAPRPAGAVPPEVRLASAKRVLLQLTEKGVSLADAKKVATECERCLANTHRRIEDYRRRLKTILLALGRSPEAARMLRLSALGPEGAGRWLAAASDEELAPSAVAAARRAEKAALLNEAVFEGQARGLAAGLPICEDCGRPRPREFADIHSHWGEAVSSTSQLQQNACECPLSCKGDSAAADTAEEAVGPTAAAGGGLLARRHSACPTPAPPAAPAAAPAVTAAKRAASCSAGAAPKRQAQ
eukprot:TRINITY_DN8876_c0_g1_i2.p1 TRINITY_DN8876_c0_g1~~TRINITY_DN8876_c0_g1_i2.p1  ORF type:complete len:371 (+),score=88.60 TRINITY_DN8876_c0_g1_i2:92-1204(+)